MNPETIFYNPPTYDIYERAMPLSETDGWGLIDRKIRQLHDRNIRGQGVCIVVVDTGCDVNHVDLKGAIVAARDFTGSRIGYADFDGHGSHTAGTALARGDNNTGIRGWAPDAVGIIAKGLGDDGGGTGTMVAAAMRWGVGEAIDRGYKAIVLSMSLGAAVDDRQIHEALVWCIEQGAIPVLAAGNDGAQLGVNMIGYPARTGLGVCVAAYDINRKLARFSSQGPEVDTAAPGVNIVSCGPGGVYVSQSGTSMATPGVSGCVALYLGEILKASQPIPTAAQMRALISKTADDAGPEGEDWGFGAGIIDAIELVASVPKPLPEPKPPNPPPLKTWLSLLLMILKQIQAILDPQPTP